MNITNIFAMAASIYYDNDRCQQLQKSLDKAYAAMAIIVAVAVLIAICLLYKYIKLREEVCDLEKEKSDIEKEKYALEKQVADLEREKYDTSKDIREILTYIKHSDDK